MLKHVSPTICQMLCACLAGSDLTHPDVKASADSPPLEDKLARKAGSSDQLTNPEQTLQGADPPQTGLAAAAAASTAASAAATQPDPKLSSQLGQTHGKVNEQPQPATDMHVVGEELDARAFTTLHQVGANAPAGPLPAATDRQGPTSQPAGEHVIGEEQDARSSDAATAVAEDPPSASVSPSSFESSAGKELRRSGTELGCSTGNNNNDMLSPGSKVSAGQKGYARQQNSQAGQLPTLAQAATCCAQVGLCNTWKVVLLVNCCVVCQATCLALVSLSKPCITAWCNMCLLIAAMLVFTRKQ